ncbi:MAG: hypothetical protein VX777_05585 [Chlamydiota bacterium]|nr:hypothetical protein [Chlamydiota bacterium]
MSIEASTIFQTVWNLTNPSTYFQASASEIEDDSLTQEESLASKAKTTFSEKAQQLNVQIDPFVKIHGKLQQIINYEQSKYQLLYVSEEQLSYYTPKSPYGPYYYGDDVIKLIEQHISELTKLYEERPKKDQWKVLFIARQVIPGLNSIIQNYPDASSYSLFKECLISIKLKLEHDISTKATALNKAVESLLKRNENATIYDILNLYADSYPSEVIQKSMAKSFGCRLTNKIFELYVDRSDRISHKTAYGLLFAVATNVTREDLEWKYTEKCKGSATIIPFEKLSQTVIDRLLQKFRNAPDGSNLLDHFDIPISLDKFIVEENHLKLYSSKTLTEHSLDCEMCIYADIESTHIWHPGRIIQMSDVQMFDQLSKFFTEPENAQLFHDDRYISFLNVAATSIAFLNAFQNNREALQDIFDLLLSSLDKIQKKANKIYPAKYAEVYRIHWLTLIGQLNLAKENPEIDLTDYFLKLFSHPIQTDERHSATLECHRRLQPYEFLARKVAYWNRYYLRNKVFLNENSELINHDTLKRRIGTLFHVSEGDKLRLYEVKDLIERDGFICQISAPYDCENFIKNNKPIPLKITFQGTINNVKSTDRDPQFDGTGYELWENEKADLVIPEIIYWMTHYRNLYENRPTFQLDFIGHSLGGSDAQNAASFLSTPILKNKLNPDCIDTINIHTFNTSGVPRDTITRINTHFKNDINKFGKITHSIVRNDFVSRSCHGKVGAEFPQPEKLEILEVRNLGMFHILENHCEYMHSLTDNILPHKLLNFRDLKDVPIIHKYLHGITNSFTDFKGHLRDLIKTDPIAQIGTGTILLVGASLLNYQITIAAQGAIAVCSALKAVITLAQNSGESYTKSQISESVNEIAQGVYYNWYGTQILEDTP